MSFLLYLNSLSVHYIKILWHSFIVKEPEGQDIQFSNLHWLCCTFVDIEHPFKQTALFSHIVAFILVWCALNFFSEFTSLVITVNDQNSYSQCAILVKMKQMHQHIHRDTEGQRLCSRESDRPETEGKERRHVGWRLDCSRRNCSTLQPLNVHFLFVLTGTAPLWFIYNGGSNGGQLAEEMAAIVAFKFFTISSLIFDWCLNCTGRILH